MKKIYDNIKTLLFTSKKKFLLFTLFYILILSIVLFFTFYVYYSTSYSFISNYNIESENVTSYVEYKENISVEEFIISGMEKNFENKINELLALKYPKFIIDSLSSSHTQIIYNTKSDYLEVVYINNVINFVYDKIYLNVYYNEIKDYLSGTTNLVSKYENENGFNYDSNKKTVALTFDDGPHNINTDKLLNVLENNKARATFFMLGLEMNINRNTIKSVYDSGNEIALHGYTHKNFKNLSLEEVQSEIDKCNDILYEVTGKTSSLVRPPYGSLSNEIVDNLNYSYIMWNIDTDDWRYKDIDYLVNHVLTNVSDGDIILFHDIFSNSVDAVEILLPKLYEMGYQVVDVSTLANLKGKTLNNNESYFSFK